MKKNRVILVIVLIVFSSLGVALYHYNNTLPNKNSVSVFEEGKISLVVEGEVVIAKDSPKIQDEAVLLPFDVVKKYFDPNIYWDNDLKKVTITTKDKVIRMKTDNLNALVNNKPITLKIPAIEDNNVLFIPIEFLSEFYNIEINYIKESNVITIDFKSSLKQVAEPLLPLADNVVVRNGRSVRNPIIKKFQIDEKEQGKNVLRIFEEYDKWYKVRTVEGFVGYIEKRFVSVKWLPVPHTVLDEPKDPKWKPEKGKVNLVWEMMYGKSPQFSSIGKMEGLDVISPTWFQVANEKGTLINRADPNYVEWAHKNGYKVWALLSNDFSDIAMTKKFLNNTDSRDNLIKEMLAFAALYKLDGINIDFENINKEDKNALTQFVREITPFLKEQGLMVSMDVTIPDGSDTWSLCYDRKALGEVVDYIFLMAYDQHWSSSPDSGSVAQFTWVETNLKKVLQMVPKEKLMLGLPFYTRLWKEETGTDGKIKVTNPKVLSMAEARKMITDNKATVKWDNESGQFYTEFKKDNAVYKIWLEDPNSIDLKSSLVQKYSLAGVGSWRRSDEEKDVWTVLNKNLKIFENYQEWLLENKGKTYAFN